MQNVVRIYTKMEYYDFVQLIYKIREEHPDIEDIEIIT